MTSGENSAQHSVDFTLGKRGKTQDHLTAHVQAELKDYDKIQSTRKKKQSFELTMCWRQLKVQTLTSLTILLISFNTTKLGIENK